MEDKELILLCILFTLLALCPAALAVKRKKVLCITCNVAGIGKPAEAVMIW